MALQMPLLRFPTWVYGDYLFFHQLQMTILLKAEMTASGGTSSKFREYTIYLVN